MAETPSFLPVTTLFGLNLSPGKIRGLQRITNPNGTLTMVATDQNSAMIGLIKKSRPSGAPDPSYDEIVEAKIDLTQALASHCSALLIDALYGALNVVASHSIPACTGMLIRIEKSGAKFEKGPATSLPMSAYEPGLSVAKIKRIGADAVKLLAPYEPDQRDSAEHQFAFVQEIYDECRKYDILMLLEPVAIEYKKNEKGEKETKKSQSYTSRKAHTVIKAPAAYRGTATYTKTGVSQHPGRRER